MNIQMRTVRCFSQLLVNLVTRQAVAYLVVKMAVIGRPLRSATALSAVSTIVAMVTQTWATTLLHTDILSVVFKNKIVKL